MTWQQQQQQQQAKITWQQLQGQVEGPEMKLTICYVQTRQLQPQQMILIGSRYTLFLLSLSLSFPHSFSLSPSPLLSPLSAFFCPPSTVLIIVSQWAYEFFAIVSFALIAINLWNPQLLVTATVSVNVSTAATVTVSVSACAATATVSGALCPSERAFQSKPH